jgi:peptide-methionine (R)-S-oxide reductase
MIKTNRRYFLKSLLATTALGIAYLYSNKAGAGMFDFGKDKKVSPQKDFPLTLSDAEWREKLTDEEFRVLRKHGTERAFTSPLNDEGREGVFTCAGCGNALYPSSAKFDSGTGWPSFFAPVSDAAVGTTTDYKLLYPRTEVHCANCGGHLGHIFDDGPAPTGKRHCINGIALDFVPAEE